MVRCHVQSQRIKSEMKKKTENQTNSMKHSIRKMLNNLNVVQVHINVILNPLHMKSIFTCARQYVKSQVFVSRREKHETSLLVYLEEQIYKKRRKKKQITTKRRGNAQVYFPEQNIKCVFFPGIFITTSIWIEILFNAFLTSNHNKTIHVDTLTI